MTTLPGGGMNATDFYGAVFDGSYVYFVPEANPLVVRYHVSAPFTSASSWELFDVTTLPSQNLSIFQTGVFDGTYVYLVPSAASGEALRYDISMPFADVSSWALRAPAPNTGSIGAANTPAFASGGFDGRFVYFVPSPIAGGMTNGLTVRYDETLGTFSDAGWSSFNASNYTNGAGAAVFDGEYFYFAGGDYGDTTFARFQARDTAAQPKLPAYYGSFF
jgi:hypothetical protein